ncbi:MAG: DUF3945 domain-containing protein [Muribaculum sp.]|nr:DUF3945 domain-containing protein [Muribaculum sp.]
MQEYDIPYEQLENIGITLELLNQLPDHFKTQLKLGVPTGIIVVQTHNDKGYIVEMPMKLQIQNDEYGKSELKVYPVCKEFANDMNLPQSQFEELKNGKVLHIDGQYIQRDPETNSVIKVSDQNMAIEKKFAEIEKFQDIELGVDQKNQLKNGKPVELEVGGEKVVMDIDLKNPNFFRTLHGDLAEWEYNKKMEYDILHPEYLGVVKTDENRWEYQQMQLGERFQEALDQKPKMTRSSGMSMH